jgi:hypothetical protein
VSSKLSIWLEGQQYERPRMKRFFLCALLLAFAAMAPGRLCADALTFDVLSQSYSIPQNPFGDDASAIINPESISVHVFHWAFGASIAQITWRPSESSILDLSISGGTGPEPGLGTWWVTIEDLTTGTTLVSDQAHPVFPGQKPAWENDDHFSVPVDSSHTYLLKDLAGYGTTDGAGDTVDMTLSSAPDGSSTTLLLGIALAGVAGLGRLWKVPTFRRQFAQ